MEPIVYMSLGAAGVISLVIARLAAKHGWAWAQDKLKAGATKAEADFKTKIASAVGDLDARVRDVVHSELARIENDIAALKAKVGGLS